MRPLEQHPFHLPDIAFTESPVVRVQHTQIYDCVCLDASREVDVLVEITERKRARRREYRLPAVQAGIARARYRSPPVRSPIHEDHVIQQIRRLETEHEGREAMLLEHDGSSQRRLETVHGAGPDDPAKAAERFTAAFG